MSTIPDFCRHCGDRLPPLRAEAIACPNCGGALFGSKLPVAPISRTKSGAPRPSSAPTQSRLSRSKLWKPALVAGLLTLLLPGAGQFYNGHVARGFVVLATFWLILPWILGVVDAAVSAHRAARRSKVAGLTP